MRLAEGDPLATRPVEDEVDAVPTTEPDGPFRREASWVVRWVQVSMWWKEICCKCGCSGLLRGRKDATLSQGNKMITVELTFADAAASISIFSRRLDRVGFSCGL